MHFKDDIIPCMVFINKNKWLGALTRAVRKIPYSASGLCLQDGFHFKILAVVFTIFISEASLVSGEHKVTERRSLKVCFCCATNQKAVATDASLLPAAPCGSAELSGPLVWPISPQNQGLDKMAHSTPPTFPLTRGNHLHLSYQRPSPFCDCLLYSN